MTDEVAALVLRHNYQQSQAISVAEAQAADEHDRLERFMRALERPEKEGAGSTARSSTCPTPRRCARARPTSSG